VEFQHAPASKFTVGSFAHARTATTVDGSGMAVIAKTHFMTTNKSSDNPGFEMC
jgi:hypothetical protein